MKPVHSWTIVALLALGLVVAGCADASDRTDAGSDADAATQPDGEVQAEGDPEPSDGDPVDTPDETTVALLIESVVPSRGPVGGGIWVNINGAGFVEGIHYTPFGIEEVTDVVFGDNPAIDIEVIRDDLISVGTPAGTVGPVDVTVENPNGRVTLQDAFTYFENVTALRVDPADLSCFGGTPFAVEGTGFTPDTTVIVGGRPAAAVVVESSGRVSALAPPGSPGRADVEIINRNGRALLFRAVSYHPTPELLFLTPAIGPEAGGTPVVASGNGFEPGVNLLFGGTPATDPTCPSSDRLQAVTPAGVGTVDVTAEGLFESSTLEGGFVFLPEPTGSLTVTGVAPSSGPVAGGDMAAVVGEGFSAGVDQVLFGSNPCTDLQVSNDRMLWVTVPPGDAGTISVSVHTSTEQAVLADAYRYYQPLRADGIDPTGGPAEGGTPFSIQGSGFHSAVEVWFDGAPASSISSASDTEITGITPPGAPGPADVLVRDADSQSTLTGAFQYATDLSLTRIHPDYGAIAGGTYVVCYGSGFEENLRLWFGDLEASDVQVSSSSVITALTPPGNSGHVTVTVELDDGEKYALEEGFYYYDPTNYQGGASGGPIQGSFNVTVLNGDRSSYGQPIPEAAVIIADPPSIGKTDLRGQVTFSGPAFVRAVTVTVAMEGFETVTVANLDATNLTVFLFPNDASTDLDDRPECEHESVLSGRVFGFKDIPSLPSGPDIVLQAILYFAAESIFDLPPFKAPPEGLVIEQDGDEFNITLCWGNYTLYALYGAFDMVTEAFTTALFGLRRGIQLNTEEPLTDQDIVLGTYLDQSASITLQDPPVATGGDQAIYRAYAHLDLGRDGVIFLGEDASTEYDLLIEGLPSATSDSFIFVGLASIFDSYPLSYTFRRPQGDLSDGITLGPFLGFTEITKPVYGDDLADGHITWTVQDPQPELIELIVMTNELPPRLIWRMILPGDATELTLPQEALVLMPKQMPMFLIIYTADSPYFRFDSFNYYQLGTNHWTSYTINYTVFVML